MSYHCFVVGEYARNRPACPSKPDARYAVRTLIANGQDVVPHTATAAQGPEPSRAHSLAVASAVTCG